MEASIPCRHPLPRQLQHQLHPRARRPSPFSRIPVVQTFASAGASASGGHSGTEPIGQVSSSDGDQPHIRYTSGGYYEIELPGKTWDRLIPHSGISPPSTTEFQPQSSDLAYFIISDSKASGYQYSELAAWVDPSSNRYGAVAVRRCNSSRTGAGHGVVNVQRNRQRLIRRHQLQLVRWFISRSRLRHRRSRLRLCKRDSRRVDQPEPQRLQPGDDRHVRLQGHASFRSEARPIPASSPLRRRGRIISWGNSPVRMRKRRLARGRCPSFLPPEAAP